VGKTDETDKPKPKPVESQPAGPQETPDLSALFQEGVENVGEPRVVEPQKKKH